MSNIKVKVTYPSGYVDEFERDCPYRIYNSICPHGIYRLCKSEIVECDTYLKYGNTRENWCDSCPIKDWCKVFESKGKPAYGVMVGVGDETCRMHSVLFEHKEDAEKLMHKYISDLTKDLEKFGKKVRYKQDEPYHFISEGNTRWTFFVKEVRYYMSSPI